MKKPVVTSVLWGNQVKLLAASMTRHFFCQLYGESAFVCFTGILIRNFREIDYMHVSFFVIFGSQVNIA